MTDIDFERTTNGPALLEGAILLYGEQYRNGFAMWAKYKDGELCEPTPICETTIQHFINRVRSESRTWTDTQTLAVAEGELLWWSPAGQRRLFWETNSDDYLNSLSGGLFHAPALVWHWQAGRLHLWALENDQRPNPHTRLHRAPFFNIGNAHVCLGSSQIPQNPNVRHQSDIERGFFASAFTHSTESCLKDWPGTPGEFWQQAGDASSFPTQYLRDTNQTLEAALKELERYS